MRNLTATVTSKFANSGFSYNHTELHLNKTIIISIIIFPHIYRKALEKPFKMKPVLNFNLSLKFPRKLVF